jgi:hypothetical protein
LEILQSIKKKVSAVLVLLTCEAGNLQEILVGVEIDRTSFEQAPVERA